MGKWIIQTVQLGTLAFMWLFCAGITVWVIRLGIVSHELSDAFTASVAISLIALPVYWALASILTYTFFGLRRGAKDKRVEAREPRETRCG